MQKNCLGKCGTVLVARFPIELGANLFIYFIFYFLSICIYPPDLQESVGDVTQRATVKRLLRLMVLMLSTCIKVTRYNDVKIF